MAGQTPKVRTVVDVEDDTVARGLGNPDRFELRRGGIRLRKVSARHEDGARASYECLIDVLFAKSSVGAILPIENERISMLAGHAEKHERRQSARIRRDAAGRDPLALQLFNHESTHRLIAYTCDQRGAQTQARSADRNIGRAAADGLFEAQHVLEAAAELLSVEIDAGASDRDQIQA